MQESISGCFCSVCQAPAAIDAWAFSTARVGWGHRTRAARGSPAGPRQPAPSRDDERRLKKKESKRKEEQAQQLVRTHIQTDDVWEQCFH